MRGAQTRVDILAARVPCRRTSVGHRCKDDKVARSHRPALSSAGARLFHAITVLTSKLETVKALNSDASSTARKWLGFVKHLEED